MKVLVCDDEPEALEKIESLLDRPCREAGAELIISDRPEQLDNLAEFDLAFLDIDMARLDGMTLARRLRAARPDAVIVFVTNFVQYAPEGYEVQAFRYLLKPDLDEKLPACFALAMEELCRRRQTFTVRADGEEVTLLLRDILYFESDQRTITAHLTGTERPLCRFTGGISDLSESLGITGFLRVHRSYLVNMAYIQRFQYGQMELRNGVQLPVSKKYYRQLKQQYLLWKGRTAWRMS